jgi:ABC-type sulfate transport system substrate-binding protein
MAKDNREIVHGIRVMMAPSEGRRTAQSRTITSGMEDELAAAFTQKELDAMKERGDITGNWKSSKGKFTPKET